MNSLIDKVTLHEVDEDDREFLIRVIKDARSDELALTPWDESQKRAFIEHQLDSQTNHYFAVYPSSLHQIIRLNGEPVGRLFINFGSREIAILDVSVLSEFRGRGVGTFLIRSIQEDARGADRSIRIFIESYNPSCALFEKLGFSVAEVQDHLRKYTWQAKTILTKR